MGQQIYGILDAKFISNLYSIINMLWYHIHESTFLLCIPIIIHNKRGFVCEIFLWYDDCTFTVYYVNRTWFQIDTVS